MTSLADPAVAASANECSPDRRAKNERLLAAIGQASEQIIGAEFSDGALRDALALVGSAAEVSRVRVFRFAPERAGVRQTAPWHEWCAPGIEPANPKIADRHAGGLDRELHRWYEAFARGEVIAGPAGDFPPAERALLAGQNVRSVILMPICTPGGLWGFVGFDDCVNERAWAAETLGALRVLSRVLGAAFERAEYRRRAEALEANQQALLDNLNEAVFKTDHRGRFTYLNEAWRTLTGRDPAEAVGRFCGDAVIPDDRGAYRRVLVNLINGRLAAHRCELRLQRADGTLRWAQVSVRRSEEPSRGRCELVGTIVDISANKQVEEQLIAAKQEAEATSRAKSEFLSTMSHELRTPLNAVIGLSESMLETLPEEPDSKTRRYLELIHGSGRQLYQLINDILELARIEAGRVKLELEPVDLGLLCGTTVEALRKDAAAKSLQLELHLPAERMVVRADDRILGSAIHRLLVNAVKFTPSGGHIAVTVSGAEGVARIAVADTGIGIEPDKLDRLFKPFSQVDSSLSRRFGGTGLGLALVDRFIRLHGGTVSVASRPVFGSTFTIELPAGAPPPPAHPSPAS